MIIVCCLHSAQKSDSPLATVFRLLTTVLWNKYCLKRNFDFVNFMLVSVGLVNFTVSVDLVNFMLVSVDLVNLMLVSVDLVNFML
jgi:hypothetical protein